MRSIEGTLTLWQVGILSSDQVIEWAIAELERSEVPSVELIDLISDGPERCLKRPAYEFRARPLDLGYVREFSLRAIETSMESDDSILRFAKWAARCCIGEDLSLPMVLLGYQLDELLFEVHDEAAAIALVRETLPPLLQECREATQFLDL